MPILNFTKRRTYSSRLVAAAYDAGRRGRHGVRGDEHFEGWLDREEQRCAYPLHSAFVHKLRAEYFRGMEAHEEALKAPEAPQNGRPRPRAQPQSFCGHRIEPTEGGEFIVPSLDRESRFEDLKQAKRFIRAYAVS